MADNIAKLQFLTEDQVRKIAKEETPVFVYSRKKLKDAAAKALKFRAPYGLTVRYAMKANPHPQIISIFNELGIGIDASSEYEVDVALKAGVAPENIHITSQQLPKNMQSFTKKRVRFTATSLHQLEMFGQNSPGSNVGIRINPGPTAKGYNNRLTTAGPAASYGIWYEYIDEIFKVVKKYKLKIDLLHSHAGTGVDPEGWLATFKRNIELLEYFPDVSSTSLGGGFKINYEDETLDTDLEEISRPIENYLKQYYQKTGRKIKLEIEPGRFLVARACTLVSEIIDKKDTGTGGYKFIIVNSGMTEFIRSAMFAAQHPLIVVNKKENEDNSTEDYVVAGHCCESSDVFTVDPKDPDIISTRELKKAEIGDCICLEAAGAYCANFSTIGYNSFPKAKELFID